MTRYKFKGYTITNCGYHQPDHCVWWEAVDANGNANFHGHTLREVEFMICDYEWEQKLTAMRETLEYLRDYAASKDRRLIDAKWLFEKCSKALKEGDAT